jgi:D-alanyl-lipoteichoic acid acyltransferase DltB (MBOAT superfamily)
MRLISNKYFNFFADNFVDAFTLLGTKLNPVSIQIVLPVGISFYTFQALSYTIDVYRKKLEPTKSIIDYFAFISFFPQLVAGPIERATNLLPQFYKKRTFNYSKAVDGLRQILWGLFKKIVIADNCAELANQIFNNSADYSGYTLILGALFFAFQIYGDFSGYSDIAIGTAKLFGFEIMRNFAFPYFSRDIAEFWRRWHISLSTWFRDYLYIPLGGSKGGTLFKIRNTFIIFIVSGFWHGANWTFIVWGALNAIYFLPLMLTSKNRTNIEIVAQGKYLPNIKEFFQIALTFGLTVLAWIFFRANNLEHAFDYINGIFSNTINHPGSLFLMSFWKSFILNLLHYKTILILIVFFLTIEWFGREQLYAIEKIGVKWYKPLRWAVYYCIVLSIFYFAGKEQQFIYFQF